MCFAGVLGRRVTRKLHLGVKVVAAKAMVATLTEVRMVVATLAGMRAVALALVTAALAGALVAVPVAAPVVVLAAVQVVAVAVRVFVVMRPSRARKWITPSRHFSLSSSSTCAGASML